jgi:hypothetical protein
MLKAVQEIGKNIHEEITSAKGERKQVKSEYGKAKTELVEKINKLKKS